MIIQRIKNFCYGIHTRKKGNIEFYNFKWKITLGSASLNLLKKVQEFFKENNLELNIYNYKNFYTITTSCRKALKIINLIYPKNCKLYNKRKYKEAQKMIKYYEKKDN